MEEPEKRRRREIIGTIFILLLILIVVLLYRHYFRPANTNMPQSPADNAVSNDVPAIPSSETKPETTSAPKDNPDTYYSKAIKLADTKDYDGALAEIDKALELDRNNEIYWAKKASFYALKNDTANEKITLEEGLKIIPGSDLLKTRLDVIGEDISTGAEGVRE